MLPITPRGRQGRFTKRSAAARRSMKASPSPPRSSSRPRSPVRRARGSRSNGPSATTRSRSSRTDLRARCSWSSPARRAALIRCPATRRSGPPSAPPSRGRPGAWRSRARRSTRAAWRARPSRSAPSRPKWCSRRRSRSRQETPVKAVAVSDCMAVARRSGELRIRRHIIEVVRLLRLAELRRRGRGRRRWRSSCRPARVPSSGAARPRTRVPRRRGFLADRRRAPRDQPGAARRGPAARSQSHRRAAPERSTRSTGSRGPGSGSS